MKVKEECIEYASRKPITSMDFPPATMCDLFGARVMAAYTIAIGAVGGFAIDVYYSYFATVADYFVTTDIDFARTAKSLFIINI
jgi:hypothetical protein